MIRDAALHDIPTKAELLGGLAPHEEVEHDFRVDASQLSADLFSDRPNAEVIVAEETDSNASTSVVGFALFFPTYSTLVGRRCLHLADLFVLPEHRGRGHGRALLSRLAGIALERGWARIDWVVLDSNATAIGFYRSLGAIAMDDRTTFRVSGEALRLLAQ